MSVVGQNVKRIRQEKNISQYRLSKLSGVAQATISAIEADGQTRSPAVDTIEKLAVALDCKTSDLMGEKKPATNSDGLRDEVVSLLLDLPADDLQEMRNYAAYLKSRRGKE